MDSQSHPRLDEIPEWNQVARGGGLYSSSAFLRYAERGGERYLAVRDGGRAVAVAACCLGEARGALHGPSDPWWLFDRPAPDPELEAALYPVLFCGSVRGHSGPLLLDEPRALGRLVAAVREEAARRGARAIAFGFLPPDDARALRAVDPRLRPVFALGEAVLDPVASFAGYLAALGGHQRKRARSEMRRFAALMRFERRRLSEVIGPLAELFPRWAAKFGHRLTPELIRRTFEKMVEVGLDGQTRCYLAWQGDLLAGLSLCVRHGDTYYARNFVAHPDAPREAALYFNLNFFEPVRQAEEEGVRAIHYAENSLEPKVQRGCRVRPLWFVLDAPALAPGEQERLRAASRARLERAAAELRPYRGAEEVRAELALDGAAELLDG